ncbi:RES domain-containing protein [Desulfopila sp. IMCC35006]|uniref:RES family NAD+ phosphorylase n=1 Tax=Desulfopila sp. IMCC35006 TaxID=2569542 RepID=UPI0010ACE3E9|nr:RES family NAD+ phosphorylase [Desulfopila sp. IMCC35006]TKB27449.1 RES domain-containing protein [Desulfopila sp. IMCC35006]
MIDESVDIVACSNCFEDHGLKIDAQKIGIVDDITCPVCKAVDGYKLKMVHLETLAYGYFVWGSLVRCDYGAAPCVQFNNHQKNSIGVPEWCKNDVNLISQILGVGFFHYGPRMWMVGEVEPLKDLQKDATRPQIVKRIVSEYPQRILDQNTLFYRIRKEPKKPTNPEEYDSPPSNLSGSGRFESNKIPVLYASPDLEVCVHESRFTAEDELYVATLSASSELNLLDMSVLLNEGNGVTEFESLDMAVHMLFLASSHSYHITKSIAISAHDAGYDGIIYPSYFSLLRTGATPFETVYGISHRMIPQYRDYEEAKSIPNLAIFGRPVAEGKVSIKCINKLIMRKVSYDFHFGIAEVL